MTKGLRWNPILKKEMQVNSRSIKMSWGIFGLNALLSVVVVLFMLALEADSVYSGYEYDSLAVLFPILGTMECVILSFLIPILTSGSISGERERQTLDLMLTTPVKPFSIALGKLGSAMLMVMMYVVSSIPALSIAFVLGGLRWSALLGLLCMLIYLGIYVGSLGVFCSSRVKKSVSATILAFVILILVIALTLLIFACLGFARSADANKSGLTFYLTFEPLVLLLNPYSAFLDFMLRSVSSVSLFSMISSDNKALSPVLAALYRNWIPVCIVVNLAVSLLYLLLAAKSIRIGKVRGRKGKRGKPAQ